MDVLIPNNYVHITGGKDLEITTGIPCKITNDGHYLDNGGGTFGSYVTLSGNSYDRNDPNYSNQIWFIVESSNFGKYRISSNGNYLDTFGGENASECRMSYENHCDNPYYSRQLWTFLNQNISEYEKVQIQNLSNKCYLDNWANQYSIVRFSSYFNKPTDSFYSRQLWKFEIADYKLVAEIKAFKYDKKINDLDSYTTKVSSTIFASRNQSHSGSCKIELTLSEKTHNITSWSFNKSKEIAFLNKLDVDIKAEYAGVKGNLPEVIEWDNQTKSLETIKKIKLDETNVSGKYSMEIQNKEEVEVKIIWHKINLDVQFTATTKIKGFSDRLRKNGSIAKMEQVDINAVLCFLSNSGFEGTIIGAEGNNVLVEITGNVNIQGALKYEIEKSSDDPFSGVFFVEIENNKSIYELKKEIIRNSPRLSSINCSELAIRKVNIPIDQCNALQQFTFNEEDCLHPLKTINECFDGKIPENCLHIVFEIKPVYTKREDVQSDIIQSFGKRLDFLPLVQNLEQVLLMEFDIKIPIRSQIYDEWKGQIPMLDKYFCNEDKENKTANYLSSRCESVIGLLCSESEFALTRYENLISNIWDALKEGVAYVIDLNRSVKEYTDMGNWNNSFYGPVPYLLSYAAGGKSLQFFAITNKKQLIPISSQYDLTSPLGEFSVLISSFNIFRLLVTIHDFLPEYGIPLYKEIKRNCDTYITILSEDT
ncbi:18861_t:CDS:2, partial [Racocetra persica]